MAVAAAARPCVLQDRARSSTVGVLTIRAALISARVVKGADLLRRTEYGFILPPRQYNYQIITVDFL